ncbi:IS66 family transposase [Faecalicatena contorta]|uniref:IS66 family transposase n=1 Tax=Faecalicatena contorta TaxID=39482 RepID=UPI001F3EC245|nr:IS66 family transposase [Faecalicatena contorta]MCF2684112.1 IS66 family transposase [Faecalicatena contorta]
MDPEGQNILFRNQLEQKDLMIQMLSERLNEKDETITDLKETIKDLKVTIVGLQETLNEFQRRLFGTSSEKTKQDEKPEETVTTTVKSHKRTTRKAKATREDQYGNLPIRKEVIPLSEEDKHCPYCNSLMEYVTETFVREELRITPAKVERIHYYQEKWQCPECKKDGDGTFAESKTPTALIPHSPASPSIVSYVAMEKIGLAMPYYRQEFLMQQLGFTLPRETMANWIIYVAEHYFYPIYDRLHEELLKRDLVHADETTCQVLREKGRAAEQTSYMWLYTTGNDGLIPIVLYDYQPSRKGSCVQNFLEGFHGLVQCDGYQGYNKLEDVILVCCLAHARRKFFEAVPAAMRKRLKLLDINSDVVIEDINLPDEEEAKQLLPAEIGLLYCNKLFYLDRTLKDLDPEERKQQRTVLEQPVWDQFWNWLDTLHPTGGSKLGKAVVYAQNHHETLMNYLLDGRCEISNNRAERKAKSYAVGRKAFLFHTSEAGAGASAVMYSIVETAKANNLNIFQYLYTVLLYIPDYLNSSAGIEQLMPWSKFIKEQCSGLIDVESNVPENRIPLPNA